MTYSQSVLEIEEAVSIRINQKVYDLKRSGFDPIVLSLGEAYFDIPMKDFSVLDFQRGYHYSDTKGLPELRKKIAKYYFNRYYASVDSANEILITAGSKIAVFMALRAILNFGDEIVVQEPCWLSYPHQASLCGANTVFIPHNVLPCDFGRYFTNKTRVVIINNPNNPSGLLYSREEIDAIYKECLNRNMWMIVDEAYSDFIIDRPYNSIAEMVADKKSMILVNSLSKNMGMSGWRIGYAISSKETIDILTKLNQHLITCAPTILMQYVERYFDDILECTLPQVRKIVERRNKIARIIDNIGIKRLPGDATFYFFLNIDRFNGTSEQFADILLESRQVSVVPGSAYGKSTDRFIRIGIGAESDERIYEALHLINNLIILSK
jgi:aspartate/methionine/tyrosine aminotransferase